MVNVPLSLKSSLHAAITGARDARIRKIFWALIGAIEAHDVTHRTPLQASHFGLHGMLPTVYMTVAGAPDDSRESAHKAYIYLYIKGPAFVAKLCI